MARKQTLEKQTLARDANLLGLAQACKDEPDDDDLRGILADYLEDHGQPERAEFLRLSLQRHSAPALARMARLRVAHQNAWLGAVPAGGVQARFRRGMMEITANWLQLTGARFDEWLEKRGPWVESLRLHAFPVDGLAALHDVAAARHFSALELFGRELDTEGMQDLVSGSLSPRWRKLRLQTASRSAGARRPLFSATSGLRDLRELHLQTGFTLTDARDLVKAPFAPGLRELSITSPEVSAEMLAVLADGLPQLRVLRLTGGGLAGFLLPPSLRELHLSSVAISDGAMSALAQSSQAGSLVRLSLINCGVNDSGARALAGSQYLGNLRELTLAQHLVGADGLRALAESSALPRLERLELTCPYELRSGSELLPIVQSDRWPALAHLAIEAPQNGHRLLSALLQGPLTSRLRSLTLGHSLTSADLTLLGHSPGLRGLESLRLSLESGAEPGLVTLARSATLERLLVLGIISRVTCDAGLTTLAAGPGLPALTFLRFLNVHGENSSPEALTALRQSPRRASGFFVDVFPHSRQQELMEISNLGLELEW